MQSCNFCEKESCLKIVKIRAGFFLETFVCEDHKKINKNEFSKYMKAFVIKAKDKYKESFNELNVVKKLNEDGRFCSSCGTNAEMLLSTGFTVCKDCISMFKTINGDFFSNKNEIENSEVKTSDKEDLTVNKIIEDNKSKIIRLNEKMKKYVEKQDFAKCIEIRDSISELEKENELLLSDNIQEDLAD